MASQSCDELWGIHYISWLDTTIKVSCITPMLSSPNLPFFPSIAWFTWDILFQSPLPNAESYPYIKAHLFLHLFDTPIELISEHLEFNWSVWKVTLSRPNPQFWTDAQNLSAIYSVCTQLQMWYAQNCPKSQCAVSLLIVGCPHVVETITQVVWTLHPHDMSCTLQHQQGLTYKIVWT